MLLGAGAEAGAEAGAGAGTVGEAVEATASAPLLGAGPREHVDCTERTLSVDVVRPDAVDRASPVSTPVLPMV